MFSSVHLSLARQWLIASKGSTTFRYRNETSNYMVNHKRIDIEGISLHLSFSCRSCCFVFANAGILGDSVQDCKNDWVTNRDALSNKPLLFPSEI